MMTPEMQMIARSFNATMIRVEETPQTPNSKRYVDQLQRAFNSAPDADTMRRQLNLLTEFASSFTLSQS